MQSRHFWKDHNLNSGSFLSVWFIVNVPHLLFHFVSELCLWTFWLFAHNILEVNLDLDQNDTKFWKSWREKKLSKKFDSLFAAVLKMEFLGLCWCCLDMSQVVTSVMFCYVNMLRWITARPQQPKNVNHQHLDTKWEPALVCAQAFDSPANIPQKHTAQVPCAYWKEKITSFFPSDGFCFN